MCGFCGLIGAITSLVNKPESASVQNGSDTNVKVTATPTPSVPRTFAELKKESERLLAFNRDDYESVELKDFDAVMKPLSEMPKDSKDYKAAQSLHKKLVEKVANIGAERILLGPKPMQSGWDGDVLPVKQYLREVLNDYDSSEFVEWSPVSKIYQGKEPYWGVRLRLRAKNGFGAYIVRDTYYYIRHNQVVKSTGLSLN